MKINRFNESEVQNLSSDRTDEIIKSLQELSVLINQKDEIIESLVNELNNFRDVSKSKNDQIDDSISNLQIVKSSFVESLDKMNNVVISLNDYKESGRKYLY
jgi:ABC-type transporter Mla subunit MlaD